MQHSFASHVQQAVPTPTRAELLDAMPDGASVLVTGVAGFIGSHAAERLAEGGFRVVGADNFDDFYDRAWKRANLACIAGGVDVEEIDITDGAAIDRLVARLRPAAILHLAAMAGVRPSIEQPAYYARVNVEGTVHLLDAARRHGVGRFVFASSSSVYGDLAALPFREADAVAEPLSPYAATKRAGELICYTFHHLYKLPVACLRYFTVYGPRQRPDLAIHKFTRLIDAGLPVPFFGNGSTTRDYTYVDDIVTGTLAAMEHVPRHGHRVYNLGAGRPVTLAQLVAALERAIGKPARLDPRPPQPGDVSHTHADIARASDELDYAPQVSLDEGLRRFVAWYRGQGHLYPSPNDSTAPQANPG